MLVILCVNYFQLIEYYKLQWAICNAYDAEKNVNNVYTLYIYMNMVTLEMFWIWMCKLHKYSVWIVNFWQNRMPFYFIQ